MDYIISSVLIANLAAHVSSVNKMRIPNKQQTISSLELKLQLHSQILSLKMPSRCQQVEADSQLIPYLGTLEFMILALRLAVDFLVHHLHHLVVESEQRLSQQVRTKNLFYQSACLM